jgi:hypothetical protein
MNRALIIAAIGAAIVAGGFLLSGPSRTSPAGPPPASGPVRPDDSTSARPARTVGASRVLSRSTLRGGNSSGEMGMPEGGGEWSARIDELLGAEGTDAEISRKLLEMYPTLPPDGQAEAAPHLAALTPNEDHRSVANILTNAATPGEVADILLTDLLDRPDSIRLPLLLEIMRTPDNPVAADARDMLEALMGEDYGDDWELWAKKISEWQASHPE